MKSIQDIIKEADSQEGSLKSTPKKSESVSNSQANPIVMKNPFLISDSPPRTTLIDPMARSTPIANPIVSITPIPGLFTNNAPNIFVAKPAQSLLGPSPEHKSQHHHQRSKDREIRIYDSAPIAYKVEVQKQPQTNIPVQIKKDDIHEPKSGVAEQEEPVQRWYLTDQEYPNDQLKDLGPRFQGTELPRKTRGGELKPPTPREDKPRRIVKVREETTETQKQEKAMPKQTKPNISEISFRANIKEKLDQSTGLKHQITPKPPILEEPKAVSLEPISLQKSKQELKTPKEQTKQQQKQKPKEESKQQPKREVKVKSPQQKQKEEKALKNLLEKIQNSEGLRVDEEIDNEVIREQKTRIQELSKMLNKLQKKREDIRKQMQKIKKQVPVLEKEVLIQREKHVDITQKFEKQCNILNPLQNNPQLNPPEVVKDPYTNRKAQFQLLSSIATNLRQKAQKKKELLEQIPILEIRIKQREKTDQQKYEQQVNITKKSLNQRIAQITSQFRTGKKKYDELMESSLKKLPRSEIAHSFVSSGIRMKSDDFSSAPPPKYSAVNKTESDSQLAKMLLTASLLFLFILVLLHAFV